MNSFGTLWRKFFLIFLLAGLVSCSSTPKKHSSACAQISQRSAPGTARPFVFNHAHLDNAPWWTIENKPSQWRPQTVPVNSCIKIQLPSDPTKWTVTSLVINGVETSTGKINQREFTNINRYLVPCQKAGVSYAECPSQISQFELSVEEVGITKIAITGNPPAKIPQQLDKFQNGFKQFTLTLKVTE